MDGIRLAGTPGFVAISSPTGFGVRFGSPKTSAASWLQFSSITKLNCVSQKCGAVPGRVALSGGRVHPAQALPSLGSRPAGDAPMPAAQSFAARGVQVSLALAATLRLLGTHRHITTAAKAIAWISRMQLSRIRGRWLTAIGALSGLLPVGLATGPKVIGACAAGNSTGGGMLVSTSMGILIIHGFHDLLGGTADKEEFLKDETDESHSSICGHDA